MGGLSPITKAQPFLYEGVALFFSEQITTNSFFSEQRIVNSE